MLDLLITWIKILGTEAVFFMFKYCFLSGVNKHLCKINYHFIALKVEGQIASLAVV